MKESRSVSGLVGAVRGAASRSGGVYKYDLVPEEDQEAAAAATQRSHRRGGQADAGWMRKEEASPQRGLRVVRFALSGVCLLAVILVTAVFSPSGRPHDKTGCELRGNCTGDVSHLWGQYSPYFSVPSGMDPRVPAGCEVTFAQVLSRHGARWPTRRRSAEYRAVVEGIQRATTSYGAGYEFIRDYEYGLGLDELTALGQRQMAESGAAFFERYEALARAAAAAADPPFIRASGSSRVVMSAQNWTRGFYERMEGGGGGDGGDGDLPRALADMLILPETDQFNNTLEHVPCPRFEDGPHAGLKARKQAAWREVWAPPIKRRLEAKLRGANLSLAEVVAVMELCPFETVAAAPVPVLIPAAAARSPFCALFSHDEWTGYDYHQSLDKWYGYGRGNPLGPTQGIGFGNELIARLTGQPVRDNTTTNRTLDGSPATFPLGRRLYADFSHDNTMSSIFAALGLFDGTQDLPAGRKLSPRRTHGFSAAWAVPFSARMYVEKMRCGSERGDQGGPELVRVLLNDRVMPLRGCGMDALGRCELGAFVKSLSFVRHGGLWGEC
ncbi:3-phytase A [Escovopsis weberi]|uniref:3-phytase n=1 Tax=Escovopsis weberi TaxID=150374 RepID=A0A0M8N767_ESCWE|nr:3-phytase A [Escovopsis weberi]